MHKKVSMNVKYIFSNGKKLSGKYIITHMIIKKENLKKINYIIISSRKVGNAVQRNRIKRLLRESFFEIEREKNINIDIIVILKYGIGTLILDKNIIKKDIEKILIRAGYHE